MRKKSSGFRKRNIRGFNKIFIYFSALSFKVKLSVFTLFVAALVIPFVLTFINNKSDSENLATYAQEPSQENISPSVAISPTLSLSLSPTPTPTSNNTAIIETLYQGGGCGPANLNTYPKYLCDIPMGSAKDSLGYPNRFCGSYAAWMEESTGHRMPAYRLLSYAAMWPSHVPSSWIVSSPKAGDIAIRPSIGFLPNGNLDPGHAMYIVSGNYQHTTSDLLVKSYNSDDKGDFSYAVWAPSGYLYGHYFHLIYIRFPLASQSASIN